MGNCVKKELESSTDDSSDYKKLYPIGKGACGLVWKVQKSSSGAIYAMKQMNKKLILSKNSLQSILNERDIIKCLSHPFLVNFHCAFQDLVNVYLVTDLMSGGDLRYFFIQNSMISERKIKFFTCCIILALEYLHSNGIIHGDLKPENLVFDHRGYLHLTDFGSARKIGSDNRVLSGTPSYMSPEVLAFQDHSAAADFYSLGVILFEATTGYRPYSGNSRKEVRENMLKYRISMSNSSSWSNELKDFINKLLQRKQENRLGFNGINEIKEHPWIKDFSWSELNSKVLDSPCKIKQGDNFDKIGKCELKTKICDIGDVNKHFADFACENQLTVN